MEKLTIVSVDSHAQAPASAWKAYLDKRYHEYLPRLAEENAIYTSVMKNFWSRTHNDARIPIFDQEGVFWKGLEGVWDKKVRLREMDREGIAAEFIFNGDPRICGMFFQSSNSEFPQEVCHAGVKAYHRWLVDEFGDAKDRLRPIALIGAAPWRSAEEAAEELDFVADNGFGGAAIPTYVEYPGIQPLVDRYWDPLWARMEERNIPIWIHAGHGEAQGELGKQVFKFHRQVTEEGGNLDDLVTRLRKELFNGKLFTSYKPRRAMWQLMLGGVFDRFPKLKFVMNEVYGDWMPDHLKYLDKAFEENRDQIPAKRKPTEYWADNGLVCLSFARRCDVAARYGVGVKTVAFGRDYPHAEGTWPNTLTWMRTTFDGVPAEEIQMILQDNPIRFFNMDREHLGEIAQRINSPSLEDITRPAPAPRKDLLQHMDERGHIFLPSEADSRVPETAGLLKDDLWRVGAA